MHKNVFMLPMSFTGSYTQRMRQIFLNLILLKKLSCVDKVANFRDFSRPNKEIKYFSRT